MASLKESVKALEDNIITISGPALAISGIIAGIDVLTSNVLKTYFPGASAILGVVWAICLMLTLDFQVLTLGVKSRRIYQSEKPWLQKIGEMALAILVAGTIAYVSVQMGTIFARTLGTQLSIDQAEVLLGINPTALYYERSAMVMLLIFMSGWLRDSEPGQTTQVVAQPVVQASTVKQEDVDQVLKALAEVQSLREQLAQLQAVKVAEVQPAVQPLQQVSEHSETLSWDHAAQPMSEPVKAETGFKIESYGPRITALYRDNPAITIGEIMATVGCSRPTAEKWLQRLVTIAE
jgi:cation transport ATPase